MNFQIPMERGDTTFIDLSKSQIKDLHDTLFGEAIVNESALGMIVKLELTYIPFLIFVILMVTSVNLRWNRAYKRLHKVLEKMEPTEQILEKMAKLRSQHLNIYDRFFVYFVIWGSSLYLDATLMASGIFEFPWVSIPVIIGVIYKKLKRLVDTSALLGQDDEDIIKRFDSIIDKMIVKPFIENIADKVRNNKNKKR